MRKNIFIQDEHQLEFDENGFLKLKIFDTEEIDDLWNIFNHHLSNQETPHFLSTNFLPQKEERIKIANKISTIINSKIHNTLTNIKLWYPAFLIKPTGEDTEFKLHQDWTFVDELQYYSGNFWFPLQDTDEDNGTLYVIPKTHFTCVNSIRAQTIHEIFWGKDAILKPYCTPLNVKKGEVVFFQHSTIHYSSANISNHKRVAINCGFNSKEATLKTFFRINETEANEYEMPDNFVFEYNDIASLNNLPTGQFIQKVKIPYQHTIRNPSDLINLFIHHQ